jgi:hypothetical protein
MRSLLAILVVGGALLPGCNHAASGVGDGGGNPLPCNVTGVDSRCGSKCTLGGTECGPALYCAPAGTCQADCVIGQQPSACGSGQICGNNGLCITQAFTDDAGGCPRVQAGTTGVTPTVMFLIDQSLSMGMKDFKLGATSISRWNAMKAALTDPMTGVLQALQASVRFGAMLFTGPLSGGGTCPILTTTAPGLNQASAIDMLLAKNNPLGYTPTALSVNALVTYLKGLPADPTATGPTVIALATDGDPNTCGSTNSDINNAVKAVAAAYAAGYKVYLLSVGTDALASNIQQMANVGQGQPATGGTNVAYTTATTPDQLITAFQAIIGGQRSCDLKLSGMVDAMGAATAQISLDGAALTLNDPNGWQLKDPSTLTLLGTACQKYLADGAPVLNASFACGTIIQ